MAAVETSQLLQDFLDPISIDIAKVVALAESLSRTYRKLAAESENQFLATPVSDSILRPSAAKGGRYLAIDIGGTNLRVGFIELSQITEESADSGESNGIAEESRLQKSRVRRTLEKSWPIEEHLKHEKAEDLFSWVGDCIAEVVGDGLEHFGPTMPKKLSLGVTFSFPMIQHTLSDATLMSMGKGFAITSNLNLGEQLRAGYAQARGYQKLPDVELVAIVNDTVATLISLAYQLRVNDHCKAAMGLIVGTGNNATIPLKLSSLQPEKRPKIEHIAMLGDSSEDRKILINTEWSINGTATPLRELGIITKWDKALDDAGTTPGFQPFEYMTAGRYLGELGRLIILDYLTTKILIPAETLPPKLRLRNGLTTTFLGNLRPMEQSSVLKKLSTELPPIEKSETAWHWTPEASSAVLQVAKAIQKRASGMTAAAIIGLLTCAEHLTLEPEDKTSHTSESKEPRRQELIVGYTGGCIVHFQDYLQDCQNFLNEIIQAKFPDEPQLRVVLQACHDGGIVGAGVLAATVHDSV